eukprot:7541314-Alexandrium_andersonii.AAC.1
MIADHTDRRTNTHVALGHWHLRRMRHWSVMVARKRPKRHEQWAQREGESLKGREGRANYLARTRARVAVAGWVCQ